MHIEPELITRKFVTYKSVKVLENNKSQIEIKLKYQKISLSYSSFLDRLYTTIYAICYHKHVSQNIIIICCLIVLDEYINM